MYDCSLIATPTMASEVGPEGAAQATAAKARVALAEASMWIREMGVNAQPRLAYHRARARLRRPPRRAPGRAGVP